MVELDEIFHLTRRSQGKKVRNHVISPIYGPNPTIIGGFALYSENFFTKSVRIRFSLGLEW
jgi:hypothetical protein